jgi:GT2 family glycosyltransferase
MEIVAVIISYNGSADTVECVGSLLESSHPGLRIVVVDNGSSPPLSLPPGHADVEVVRLEANLGYSGGVNVGIGRALNTGADAVFVLNNDTIFAADAVARLAAELKGDVGIVAPRIYYAADPGLIWSDGFMAHPWTLEMRGGRRGQREGKDEEPVRAVDYVAGCAMLIHRSVLDAIGLFDEGYFALYYEDLDYCIRARRAGFGILTVPAAHVWHKVALTFGLQSPRRQYLMAYGSVRFFVKHAGRRWPLVAIARTASLGKTAGRLIIRGQRSQLAAHLRGLRDGLRDVRSE